jgi:hypothetical protein
MTGKAVLGPAQTADKLNLFTAPDDVALYVQTADRYWFAGVVKSNPWDPSNRWRTVTASAWKGWLNERIIGPNLAVNPVAEVAYGYTATEQLTIARNIINFATADLGCPTIVVGAEVSGVTRDLNWLGSDFKFAADLIDSMATRSGGFDWTIEAFTDPIAARPSLRFVPYYPQRGTQSVAMTFRKSPNSGNIIVSGEIESSSTDQRTRIWTTGAGSPPDRKMTYDQDPGVTADTTLLTESVTNYSSVVDVPTLAAHARAERAFRSIGTNTMTVVALFADIDPTLYGTGDRVQLIYSDEGLSISLPSVRIIDRKLHVNTTNGADFAEVVLDLSDTQLPATTAEV